MNECLEPNGPGLASFPAGALDLGLLLGQRRAFVAVGGRCSAAEATILRRIRTEKLYRPLVSTWRCFCSGYLSISRRHADRLISLLERFGPAYFELSQLVGITSEQYAAIEPDVREGRLLVDGDGISLLPENAPELHAAVNRILAARAPSRASVPSATFEDRVADLTRRGRKIALELLALYYAAATTDHRDLVVHALNKVADALDDPPPGTP